MRGLKCPCALIAGKEARLVAGDHIVLMSLFHSYLMSVEGNDYQ
jgi:hypothetical protein